ncbi:MAG: alpha/beta fold hydrolase [Sandaracinaceae bacterium]|nr:alpha/beta fold hydrolase [Sandaracinaceae bacterium]
MSSPHASSPAAAPLSGTSLLVRSTDGFPLGARVYEPEGPARATVLVHGAMATPQRFYRAFAADLAQSRLRVITYDYRGIGESRTGSLRGFRASMTEWATKDAAAATNLALSYSEPLLLAGHSFGGQLLGLIDTPARVRAIALVGSQFGYYGHWPEPRRTLYGAVWSAVVPATVSLLGHYPGWLGFDVDLPGGVARQWALWCASPGYLLDYHTDAQDRLRNVNCPILFYSFTDDDFAPKASVDAYLATLRGARVVHRRFEPEALGRKNVGHFGYFRAGVAPSLWQETAEFFDDALEGRRTSLRSRAGLSIEMEEVEADLAYGRA